MINKRGGDSKEEEVDEDEDEDNEGVPSALWCLFDVYRVYPDISGRTPVYLQYT